LKIAVYTCITGGYERLQFPAGVDPRLDFYCFTDDTGIAAGPWTLRDAPSLGLTAQDHSRFVKMHPHEILTRYDASLYIDGSIRIVGDIYSLIAQALCAPASVYMYDHPANRCIYQEGETIAAISHDWIWNIARQMRRYRHDGFPPNYGLFEANVIIRRHDEPMRRLMARWWKEYLSGVRRDQLSLTYAAWKESVSIQSLGPSDVRFKGRYFTFRAHPRTRSVPIALRKYLNKSIARVVGYDYLFRGAGIE
jgi:hypothetical protein